MVAEDTAAAMEAVMGVDEAAVGNILTPRIAMIQAALITTRATTLVATISLLTMTCLTEEGVGEGHKVVVLLAVLLPEHHQV